MGNVARCCVEAPSSDGAETLGWAAIGLVPRQYSTGGRANLLGISKRRDKNTRRLLVQCARSARRHSSVVACALANKLARVAWAIAAKHTTFDAFNRQPLPA
ncbi:transposase (fragment) (plasmid) [Cupriavidus taiwanensis]|uniref:Transposase n=1 Tax=Cupriavidus taiwanensis TaxID=164546 RepID=A0A375EEW8_9BURK